MSRLAYAFSLMEIHVIDSWMDFSAQALEMEADSE